MGLGCARSQNRRRGWRIKVARSTLPHPPASADTRLRLGAGPYWILLLFATHVGQQRLPQHRFELTMITFIVTVIQLLAFVTTALYC
jgi:hypothetical protein